MAPLLTHIHGEGYPTRTPLLSPISSDCPKITVHAGKCYQALIDSGTAISLLQYSTYKKIEDCYKTPIQPTTAKLNTTDGSPMMALGSTALHLQIAELKFTHNFIICDQLPETEFIFGIDIQNKVTRKFTWPMPKVEDIFSKLNGATYFTTLDL